MIVLGVCGGIAAYKSCELVRLLVSSGHDVQVIETPDACRFVGPTTFAALSRRPVITDAGSEVFPHLEASGQADLLCIAPLTATTMARIAHGEAQNVLTASALAFAGPLVAAPAMNPRMWSAAATRANAELLRTRGVEIVGPALGDTAEGELGVGRMAEPEEIAAVITRRLEAGRALAGVRVLVTAGGTREPLDAVRFVGNRSSGRMGVAVADEAARRGADVTLVRCAGAASPSAPMRVIDVETAAELETAALPAAAEADLVVMAAAVADYRPRPIDGKRAKTPEHWVVEMEPTTDILARIGAERRPGQTIVGFAAEHGEGAAGRARAKLEKKRADMIVLNDVSQPGIGFDVSENELTLITATADEHVSRRSKQACAAAILDAVARTVRAGNAV